MIYDPSSFIEYQSRSVEHVLYFRHYAIYLYRWPDYRNIYVDISRISSCWSARTDKEDFYMYGWRMIVVASRGRGQYSACQVEEGGSTLLGHIMIGAYMHGWRRIVVASKWRRVVCLSSRWRTVVCLAMTSVYLVEFLVSRTDFHLIAMTREW